MKFALITGSCGLVGSESSLFFARKNFKILGIDNNSRKFFLEKMVMLHGSKISLKKVLKTIIILNIDIRNYSALKKNIFKI